jgi:predicted nucleic acid-binding protein
MKLPDTNVPLDAVNERLPQHSVAVNWLAEAYARPTGLGFAWVALLGFVWRYLWASPVTLFGLLAVTLSLFSGGRHGGTPASSNVMGGLLACS